MTTVSAGPELATLDTRTIADALAGQGLWLDVGMAQLRVRSDVAALAGQLQATYRHFPFLGTPSWADLHVQLRRPAGVRRWLRPQVVFECDGQVPFDPFPADSPLPMLEWGANWLIGRRMNDRLLLHAGIVERDGRALVMPALPGSGKSTLTAALSLRGWRLLSDEFAALDLDAGVFHPVLKPVALKNASIDVIRDFCPSAAMGPTFPKTRKGKVAHLCATRDSAARVHEVARSGAIVLPRWSEGSATRWEPLPPQTAFSALAFNSFNYALLGEASFRAVVRLVRECPAWQLIYSDLDDAMRTIDRAWSALVPDRAPEARRAEVSRA